MNNIRGDSFLGKTISVIIIILGVIFSISGNLVLTSGAFVLNDFVDREHPLSADWDKNVKAGEPPALKVEYEPYEVSQARFYDFFRLPDCLRLNLSSFNFLLIALLFGLVYLWCLNRGFKNKDEDSSFGVFLFCTSALPQILLFLALIVSTIFCYDKPDLSTLGIIDAQMSDRAHSFLSREDLAIVIVTLMVIVVIDFAVVLVAYFVSKIFEDIAKKVKTYILNKITLGNNTMLCCQNGVVEFISIDFKLKWIPFPALFLQRRVLARFSGGDFSSNSDVFRQWLGDLSIAIEEEQLRQLSQLNMNGSSLVIGDDNSVQIMRLEPALQWRPFPQTVIHQEIIRRVSFDNFFRCLLADSKQVALEELKRLLVGSYQERFQSVGYEASRSLIRHICAKTLATLKQSTAKIKNIQDNSVTQRMAEMLQGLTDEKLTAFKQEVVASIQESLQLRISQKIKEQILTPLRGILAEQVPLVNDRGSVDALPEGTKFFFSHGETQIVVVEQKPQMRTLHFMDEFVGGDGCYNLALPYVIFVIIFHEGQFRLLYLYYANKPMVSLDSQVFHSNLPNIHGGHDVCLGFRGCRATSLSGKVEEVIAHFWQSRFNNDLNDWYRHFADQERVFRNLASWQKASQDDPLFVLKVNWPSSNSDIAQKIAYHMNGSITSRVVNFDRLISQILQSEGVNIGALARECCDSINPNNRYPKKVLNALKKQMTLLSDDICQAFETRLTDLISTPDEKDLQAAVSSATTQAVEETFTTDFNKIANQVLLRRRIDSKELIEQILTQP
ncbi:MAG: hypothetical protein Q7K65_04680 [Candidatus Buchananbacteria bacterium]|nr:hypothetical protein [Candidatus Buchananbacteria bacterium]